MIAKFFREHLRMICMILGGGYAMFGGYALLNSIMQKMMVENVANDMPDEFFDNLVIGLNSVWVIFMPILIVLGVGYFLFGAYMKRFGKQSYIVSVLFTVLFFLWSLFYVFGIRSYIYMIVGMFVYDYETLDIVTIVIMILTFIFTLLIMVLPQFLVARFIRINERKQFQPPHLPPLK